MTSTSLGEYKVHNKSLIRLEDHKKSDQTEFLRSLINQDYDSIKKIKSELHETLSRSTQTKVTNEGKVNEKSVIASTIHNIYPRVTSENVCLAKLAKDNRTRPLLSSQTSESTTELITCVREVMCRLINNAKTVSERSGRRRLVLGDLEMAFVLMKTDPSKFCSNHMRTAMSERTFWGRKVLAKPTMVVSKEETLRVSSEYFCNSINIKDYWLCIDGVQPCLPENAQVVDVKNSSQQDEKKLLLGIQANIKPIEKNAEKRLTKQTLPIEHQVYFNEIVNIITNGTAAERRKTLETLETDRGVQFLVGRLIVVIAEGIRINIGARNLEAIFRLLKLAGALIQNPHVKLDKYLHILTPVMLSCVVTKTIVEPSTTIVEPECEIQELKRLNNEYGLREAAAHLLVKLCRKYEQNRMLIRVSLSLREAFLKHHELTTIYGALYTFYAMGYLTVKRMVVPFLHDVFCIIFSQKQQKTGRNRPEKVLRVTDLVMRILYELEVCEGIPSKRTELDFVKKYSEFGGMLYSLLKEEGKLKNNGELDADPRSCWLAREEEMLPYREGVSTAPRQEYSQYSTTNRKGPGDELFDNLLDDSDKPWAEVATRLEAKTAEQPQTTSLIEHPKVVLVRRTPSGQVDYCRPLEQISLPKIDSQKVESLLPARAMSSRSRIFSVDEAFHGKSADASATIRTFLKKEHSGISALVYGTGITKQGKSKIDIRISDAVGRLSATKMRQAVVFQPATTYAAKTDTPAGKFLALSASANRL